MENTKEQFLEKISIGKETLSLDFDGVIHKNSKGFYDGTVYDGPIEGALSAIKEISKIYDIVVFSAKARKDRMLIDGKTGQQLIEEWLEKHGFMPFVKEVTSEKPRAVVYIDDKAIRFVDWDQTLNDLSNLMR